MRHDRSGFASLRHSPCRQILACALILTGWQTSVDAEDTQTVDRDAPIIVSDHALELHRSSLVFDGHNDLPWEIRTSFGSSLESAHIDSGQPDMHTDIPRLRAGGVGAQFWSVYVPVDAGYAGTAAHDVLTQIDLVRRMCREYPDTFEMALTADDVERIHESGRIASLIGMEGGYAIEESLSLLRMFYELGARYMTLTHSDTLSWADSATDEPQHDGLTTFGEEVVSEMNRLGMLVDISHVSAETMRDVLRVSNAPVIASHSSAFAIAEHTRNIPDDVLRGLANNRGVAMVNYYSGYVVPSSARIMQEMFDVRRQLKAELSDEEEYDRAWQSWRREHPIEAGTIHDVVDHIDHIVEVAGIDHVGLGSDYDGVSKLPVGLEDVSTYPRVTQLLLDRGYSDEDIRKILGGNMLRVLREAEEAARRPE